MNGLKIKLPVSGYKSRILSYPVLLVLSVIVFICVCIRYDSPFHDFDTPTYIKAADVIFQGDVDIFRTPVYPIIIGLFEAVFRSVWDVALVIFQIAVYYVSAYYLYLTGMMVVRKPRPVFWMIAVYMLSPGLLQQSAFIMTEAFSISGIVFLTYSVVRIVKGARSLFSLLVPDIWLFLLIFLRPAFIYIIPILLLFYIYLIANKSVRRTSSLCGFFALIVVIASLLCYKQLIYKRYGLHSISCVTVMNNYHIMRFEGIIDPDLAPTPELREAIISTLPRKFNEDVNIHGLELDTLRRASGDVMLELYETRAIKKYKKDYIKGIIDHWYVKVTKYPIFPILPFDWKYNFIQLFFPDMGFYFLFLTGWLIWVVGVYLIKRRILVDISFMVLVSLGLFLVTVFGSMAEYTRLNLPGLPPFFILATLLLANVNLKRFWNSRKEKA